MVPPNATDEKKPIVITIHGIRTSMNEPNWEDWAQPELESKSFEVRRLYLKNYYFLDVFWPPWRVEQCARLLAACKKAEFDSGARPHVIAHSFGTYIVGQALRRYKKDELRIDQLILCASILSTVYDWGGVTTRVRRAHNDRGQLDTVVGLASLVQLLFYLLPFGIAWVLWVLLGVLPAVLIGGAACWLAWWMFHCVGPSGICGFCGMPDGFTSDSEVGSHTWFATTQAQMECRARDLWTPYLRGALPGEYPRLRLLSEICTDMNSLPEAIRKAQDDFEKSYQWRAQLTAAVNEMGAAQVQRYGFEEIYVDARAVLWDIAARSENAGNPRDLINAAVHESIRRNYPP